MKAVVLLCAVFFGSVVVYSMEDKNEQLAVRMGGFSVQGNREHQEDRYAFAVINQAGNTLYCSLVADGHSGDGVAQLVKDNFFACVKQGLSEEKSVKESLKYACAQCEEMTKTSELEGAGSTLLVSCFEESVNKMHVLWLGDSRGVFCAKKCWSTQDHKPTNAQERKRIETAGGKVVNDTVNGVVSVSRALGDALCKRKNVPISATPDYLEYLLDDLSGCYIGASDGFWDVVENEEVPFLIADAQKLSKKNFYAKYMSVYPFSIQDYDGSAVGCSRENVGAIEAARRLAHVGLARGSGKNTTVTLILLGESCTETVSSSRGSSSQSNESGSGYTADESTEDSLSSEGSLSYDNKVLDGVSVQLQKLDQKLDQKQDQELDQKQDQELDQKQDQELDQKQDQKLDQKQDQKLDQKQENKDIKKINTDVPGKPRTSFIFNHKYVFGGCLVALLVMVVAAYQYKHKLLNYMIV